MAEPAERLTDSLARASLNSASAAKLHLIPPYMVVVDSKGTTSIGAAGRLPPVIRVYKTQTSLPGVKQSAYMTKKQRVGNSLVLSETVVPGVHPTVTSGTEIITAAVKRSTPPAGTLSGLGQHAPRTRDRIDVFLHREVRECQAIPFEDFVRHILNLTAQESLAVSQDFCEANLASYPDLVRARKEWIDVLNSPLPETERYLPFAKLANTIVAILRARGSLMGTKKVKLVFCRNDPRIISAQSNTILGGPALDGKRKPDVTVIPVSEANRFLEPEDKIPESIIPPAVPSKIVTERNKIVAANRASYPRPAFCIALGPGCTLEWNNVLSCWEFKVSGQCAFQLSAATPFERLWSDAYLSHYPLIVSTDDPSPTDALRADSRLQLASYALEALSYRGLRRHVINALIEGNFIILWFYDRGGAFVARPINLLDIHNLAVILCGMARLSLEDWGYYQDIRFPIHHELEGKLPDRLCGSIFALQVDGEPVEFTMGEEIYAEAVITGRGTTVAHAVLPGGHPLTTQPLIVKYGWPVVQRQSETEILQLIRRELLGTKNEYLLNHLPCIYATHDFSKLSDGPRGRIYRAYNMILPPQDDRVLRVIVMDELRPVTELPPSLFVEVVRDVLHCCERLHALTGIIHRDISLMNIMYRKLNIDGIEKICGVLNDWDLAFAPQLPHELGPSSKQRSGTVPYSPLARLADQPPLATVGQDFESIFWSLLIGATCTSNGEMHTGPKSVVRWFSDDIPTLRALKKDFLREHLLRGTEPVYFKPGWEEVAYIVFMWGSKLAEAFLEADQVFVARGRYGVMGAEDQEAALSYTAIESGIVELQLFGEYEPTNILSADLYSSGHV